MKELSQLAVTQLSQALQNDIKRPLSNILNILQVLANDTESPEQL